MEDPQSHKFTTSFRISRQEVRHLSGSSLRKPEKENEERLLDGCGSLSACHHSRGTEMRCRTRPWGHGTAATRRDIGAYLDGVGEGGNVVASSETRGSNQPHKSRWRRCQCTRWHGCFLSPKKDPKMQARCFCVETPLEGSANGGGVARQPGSGLPAAAGVVK
jgi:hypothetical protein